MKFDHRCVGGNAPAPARTRRTNAHQNAGGSLWCAGGVWWWWWLLLKPCTADTSVTSVAGAVEAAATALHRRGRLLHHLLIFGALVVDLVEFFAPSFWPFPATGMPLQASPVVESRSLHESQAHTGGFLTALWHCFGSPAPKMRGPTSARVVAHDSLLDIVNRFLCRNRLWGYGSGFRPGFAAVDVALRRTHCPAKGRLFGAARIMPGVETFCARGWHSTPTVQQLMQLR